MSTTDRRAGKPTRDIAALVSSLTLEEKAALTVGIDTWRTAAIPRLDIPSVRTSDGPNGARGDTHDHESVTPSVCIPSGTALGATWDPPVVAKASAVVARQAREKGARVLLAPTVNLHRHPLAGRNFECFSEDPVLTGKLAAAYIEGVQGNDVVATIKHFVGNEVEFERNTSSSEIDERALRELYLLPFEYGVRIGGVLAVMTAYNRLNGRFVTDDARLLNEILRKEWGFGGFVLTDWGGLAGTVEAATAGLDLDHGGRAGESRASMDVMQSRCRSCAASCASRAYMSLATPLTERGPSAPKPRARSARARSGRRALTLVRYAARA